MKSQTDRYNDHVNELVIGLLKTNSKKAKKLGLDKKKMTEIVKDGITYQEFLMGRKVKTIRFLGMEFTRTTKISDPGNFQKPLEIR